MTRIVGRTAGYLALAALYVMDRVEWHASKRPIR